jgi:hypothetical protein
MIIAFFVRLLKGPLKIDSLYVLFIIVWYYYALCVPFDILFGFPMISRGVYKDLNSVDSHPEVLRVLIYHLLCGLAFIYMYKILPINFHGKNEWQKYKIYLPRFWFVAGLIILASALFIVIFGAMTRLDRALMASADWRLKIFNIGILLIQALTLIYVIQTASRKRALAMTFISFLLAFSTGGRSNIVIPLLVYALRYEVKLNRKQVILFGSTGLLVLFLWKIAWSWLYFGYLFDLKNGVNNQVFDAATVQLFNGFSLSNLEGISAYSNAVILDQYENAGSLLGTSYLWTPLQMIFPRFLQLKPVETLSEHYGLEFTPDFTLTGGGVGFSAIGESWLNFGFMGPVIVGMLMGFMLKYFDEKKKGVGFILVSFIVLRFFRSDAASIFKSYVVLFGGSFLIVFAILYFCNILGELIRDGRIPNPTRT